MMIPTVIKSDTHEKEYRLLIEVNQLFEAKTNPVYFADALNEYETINVQGIEIEDIFTGCDTSRIEPTRIAEYTISNPTDTDLMYAQHILITVRNIMCNLYKQA